MWQAEHVAQLLRRLDPLLDVEFVSMDTVADQRLDLAISELGGKGAFSKEVQELVLAGAADLAVHSAKDLQAITPDGLVIAAFPERGDPRDALVGATLDELPEGATVATGSNRRRVQLASIRPDLRFVGLRGNIATRLSRLTEVDAIVMAAVPIPRLRLELERVEVLEPSMMIPQVGQGALAVECRADDEPTIERLGAIDHGPSRLVVETERAFLQELGGDCDLPAGAFAERVGSTIEIRAMLASEDESRVETMVTSVGVVDADPHTADASRALGREIARALRQRVDA